MILSPQEAKQLFNGRAVHVATIARLEAEVKELRLAKARTADDCIEIGELQKYKDRIAWLGDPKNVFKFAVMADGRIKVFVGSAYVTYPDLNAAIDSARHEPKERSAP